MVNVLKLPRQNGENTHELLVSYELYLKANSTIKQMDFIQSGKRGKNIYHCGYCGRKLQRDKGILRCNQRYLVEGCRCRETVIYKKDADSAVMDTLRQLVQISIEESKLSREAMNRTVPYSGISEMNTLQKSIAAMKKTWMLLYEQYQDGKLSREDFLSEKRSMMRKQPGLNSG